MSDDTYMTIGANGIRKKLHAFNDSDDTYGDAIHLQSAKVDVNVDLDMESADFGVLADDADFTATTTLASPVMGVYQSSPSAVTDGDLGVVGVTATRAVRVSDDNAYTEDAAAAANPVGNALIMVRQDTLAADTVTADGDNIALRSTNKGEAYVKASDTDTLITALSKAEDVGHTTADKGIMALAVSAATPTATATSAGDYQPLAVSSATGDLFVKATDTDAILGATTGAPVDEDEDADPKTAIQLWKGIKNYLRPLFTALNVAHGAADAGNPLKIGGKGSAAPAAVVDEGDRVNASFDLAGQLRIIQATAASLNCTEASASSIATNTGNIATNTTDIPNVLGTDGAAGPTKALSVGGTQATGELQEIQVDADGQLQVDVISSALPSGAATEATLATVDTSCDNIETATTDIPNVIGTDGAAGPTKALSVAGTQATGELQEVQVDADGQLQVDVVSSALPSGASTEATLATIDTDTGNIATAVTDIPNVIGTDGAAGPTKVLSVGGTQATGEIQEIQVDADGHVQVDVLSMVANVDLDLEATDLGVNAEGQALGVGVLIQGDDGTDRTNVLVDTDGHLQVDVLTAASTVVTATDLDIRNLTNVDVVTAELSAVDNAVLDTIDVDTGNIATAVTDVPNVIGTDGAAGPAKALSVAGTQATGELEELRTDADGHLQVDVLSVPSTTVTATDLDIRNLTATDVVTAELSATDNAVLDDISTDTGNIATAVTDLPNVIGTSGGAGPTKAISVAGTTAAGNLEEVLADDDGHLQVDVLSGAFTGAGDVAHDSADSGNPLKVGGKGTAAAPTAVTEADRVNAWFDLYGKLQVAVPTLTVAAETVVAGAASTLGKIGTVPAGVILYVRAPCAATTPATSRVKWRVSCNKAHTITKYLARSVVNAPTITLASVQANDTVIINGLTFTAHTDTTTVANREFSIAGGTDTLDADELVICINDATYGVPGLTAAAPAAVVTLTATTATTTQCTTGVGGARIVCAQNILINLAQDGSPTSGLADNSTTAGLLYTQEVEGYPHAYLSVQNNDGAAAATVVVGATLIP